MAATADAPEPIQIDYVASPTGRAFHKCDVTNRGILGPVGCLSPETEVMTPNGWLRIDRWRGQKILQWDNESRVAGFALPDKYVVEDAVDMLHFKNNGNLSMVVSPEHRIPVYGYKGKFSTKIASMLAMRLSKNEIPTTWIPDSAGLSMSDDMLRLWVATAADGSYPKRGNQCVFSLRKDRKKKRLVGLLNRLGISFVEQVYPKRPTETRFAFERQPFPKHLDWRLSTVSRHQAEVIMDEASYWDGLSGYSYDRFNSSCLQDAEIIQYVSHCAGRQASIRRCEKSKRSACWSDVYAVYPAKSGSAKNKTFVRCDNTTVDRTQSSDAKKYCFITKTGFFVARHNGFVFITGNSGKSSICTWEILLRAMAQEPDNRGVRKTRWAVVRNTYSELITTTIKTFREWFFEPICTYRADKPLSARIRMPLADGTRVDCEVLFLACDRVEDAGKFKSLEITGAWINEASEITDMGIVRLLGSRCGRFPKKWKDKDGNKVGGATWFGLFCDTNAPDDEHWWYETAEVKKPENWKFFYQPPAVLLAPGSTPQKPVYVPNEGQNPMIPKAENVENISAGWPYYMNQTIGVPYEHVKVFLMAQYGTVSYGKPVYPEYNDMVHYAPNHTDAEGKPRDVDIYHGLPLLLGWDFGVQNSACIIAQLSPKGQLRFIEEIIGKDIGIRNFARDVVIPILKNGYPGMRIISTGDPAGNSRAATDESTCLSILNEEGIPTQACYTNSPVARREAIRYFLNKMSNGEPGLLVGSKCPVLRKGFIGRYCFKRMSTASRLETYSGEPLKDEFSHPHDGAQYIAARIMQNDNTQAAARMVAEQDRYPGVGQQFSQAPALDLSLDMRGYF